MRSSRFAVVPALSLAALSLAVLNGTCAPAWSADTYTLDPAHAQAVFKIQHVGLSWTYGRFNDVSGKFTIDPAAPGKSSFALTIKPESVDTGTPKRDDHLRSPDFFNAKQFPTISFNSTQVKPIEGGCEVQGDFTMHGVTKPMTLVLKGGKKAEFPPGTPRTGFSTELTLHRSNFGMDKMIENIGDDVKVEISFEGVKK
jgi:polyisoprenoid-binding protein YceI